METIQWFFLCGLAFITILLALRINSLEDKVGDLTITVEMLWQVAEHLNGDNEQVHMAGEEESERWQHGEE